jgi:hypothetical protein
VIPKFIEYDGAFLQTSPGFKVVFIEYAEWKVSAAIHAPFVPSPGNG